MRVFTPVEIAEHAANKYLGVLVAAKYARALNEFPGGSAAQVALYTPHWHHFAIIRRILLRMRSWQNYIFLEGH